MKWVRSLILRTRLTSILFRTNHGPTKVAAVLVANSLSSPSFTSPAFTFSFQCMAANFAHSLFAANVTVQFSNLLSYTSI